MIVFSQSLSKRKGESVMLNRLKNLTQKTFLNVYLKAHGTKQRIKKRIRTKLLDKLAPPIDF